MTHYYTYQFFVCGPGSLSFMFVSLFPLRVDSFFGIRLSLLFPFFVGACCFVELFSCRRRGACIFFSFGTSTRVMEVYCFFLLYTYMQDGGGGWGGGVAGDQMIKHKAAGVAIELLAVLSGGD